MRPSTRILRQELLPASEEVTAHLRIPPGEPVVRIVHLRMASGEMTAVENSHIPARYVPSLGQADLTDVSLHRLLEERYGLALAHATDILEISVAGPYEAGRLQIPEGGLVALVNRLDCLADDTPLAFTQTVQGRSEGYRYPRCKVFLCDGQDSSLPSVAQNDELSTRCDCPVMGEALALRG